MNRKNLSGEENAVRENRTPNGSTGRTGEEEE